MRWAERLATARRRGFVGRTAELSRFRALLADHDEPRVVYVHGPGGVGKTALLELRWRDPAAHAALHWRATEYYRDELDQTDPQARRDLLLDFLCPDACAKFVRSG